MPAPSLSGELWLIGNGFWGRIWQPALRKAYRHRDFKQKGEDAVAPVVLPIRFAPAAQR